MQINTKFGLGDKVWVIKETTPFIRYSVCPLCFGTAKVHIADSEELAHCPRCSGLEKLYLISSTRLDRDYPCTVGRVRVELSDKKSQETTYMLHETGIGSGSLYDESKLYASKKLAQEACLQENSKHKLTREVEAQLVPIINFYEKNLDRFTDDADARELLGKMKTALQEHTVLALL